MEKDPKPDIQLPPGFRFQPSDEELIVHYLRKKANKTPLPASIVAEVELYKFNPWDLPKKSLFGDEEWYFFTPRDRKYPNGMRPNRMAASGYWKATGIDKPILASCGSKLIGVKKALVFYIGRPPKGNKTDWMMHEYRLPEPDAPWPIWRKEKSMRLDEWVLCRVRQKTGMPLGNFREDRNVPGSNAVQHHPKIDKQCSTETAPNFEMVKDYLYKDFPMLPFLFGSQDFPSMDAAVSSIRFEGNNKASSSVCEDNFNIDYLQSSATPSHVRKRKVFDRGNSEDQDSFKHSNKKATTRDYQYEEQQFPPSSDNDYAYHSGMISYSMNQLEKNNYVDQLCSSMTHQELYSLAFR